MIKKKIDHFLKWRYLSIFFLFILIDQVLKRILTDRCPCVLGDIFRIIPTTNTGISFGLFQNFAGSNALFSVIALVLVCVLVIIALREANSELSRWGFVILIAGAFGNIIDRIFHGAVIDMIDIGFRSFRFATFNPADVFISIGTIIIIVSFFLFEKETQ